ncbi:unnamed protein product [Peniophora sp. CBMAI 1063]|nr:unnamed protein product [Peniophora sp. CBMAI 1063]
MGSNLRRELHDGWSFTQIGGGEGTKDGEWLETASFPTSVHVELLRLKRIPDPFLGLNEWDVQWIGESEWAFKKSFSVSESELSAPKVELVFEGLDTLAVVELNGKKILETENMWVEHRIDVKSALNTGDNELHLSFASPFIKGRALDQQHGKNQFWNGDSGRLHIRKTQYNWGWDWGPVLMTVGPWKPIYLHTYTHRIADLRVSSNVSEDLSVTGQVTFDLDGPVKEGLQVTASIKAASGAQLVAQELSAGTGKFEFSLKPEEVELWFPIGYGKPALHTFTVALKDERGNVHDEKTKTIGFRRAQLIQRELIDQDGLSFFFEINNIPIFCGGSNWIPADSFLTTMTPERYREWLELLVQGNQNMVRVWGGGTYEDESFYDTCDELGILVWQDFMFGCGQYHAYKEFVDNVKVEAEQAVKRLRDHPSIIIFAGNNEDYTLAESMNNIPLPAAPAIYEGILPEIVAKFSEIVYHRGSPYSGHGKESNDVKYGDCHQWNVWHGMQEPWHNWDKLSARFVSEFGMQGYPDRRTVDYWNDCNTFERYPQSRTSMNHDKAEGSERRLELYLMENFKHAFDMDSYIYYTQIMQAETLSSAYRLWRRNWKGPGKEYTAGAIVWQINDCWPCVSWAIADYFVRPKPAFFAIARELRPQTVGMARREVKNYPDPLRAGLVEIRSTLEVWGTNSTLKEKKATLKITAFDLEDPQWTNEEVKDVVLAPNAATELWAGDVPGQPVRTKLSEVPRPIIISARLFDSDGSVLARYANWPEPFKYLHFPPVKDLGLKITVGADGESVELSASRPIKGIILDVEGEDAKWSDQAIDLVPGDPQTVKVTGLKGRQVKARFLGDGTA